jgi:hypothetical protein
MRLGIQVRHGIDAEGDIQSQFMRLTRRRFDANAGSDAGENDLCHAARPEIFREIRVCEGTPCPLGYGMVFRLAIEFWNKVSPVSRPRATDRQRLLVSARRSAGDIHQDDRETVTAECRGQQAGTLNDFGRGMHGRSRTDDAFLQIDDNERGLGV